MTSKQIPDWVIGPDTPVPLKTAVEMFFPAGGVTISTLRTEARYGRLAMMRIGRQDFVTRNAIEEMMKRCQTQNRRPIA